MAAALLGCGGSGGNNPSPGVDAAPGSGADAALGYRVRGTARGVLAPVDLQIAYADRNESITVDTDGPFELPNNLDEGEAFVVTLVDEPPCVLDGGSGVVQGTDAEISLTCDGVATLSSLVLSGPTAPDLGFSPTQLTYVAEVSLLQEAMAVTASAATAEATVTVAGAPVSSGIASPPMPLLLGDNDVEIVVAHPLGWMRTYRVTVQRAASVAQHTYAKPNNTGPGDFFGYSVSLSGDTLAVGAFLEDSSATGVDGNGGSNGADGSGAVYIFRRDGKVWAQEAYLKASNTERKDNFGYSVSLSGDTLAVGARFEDSGATGVDGDPLDNGALDSGAVYVFRRNGTTWAQEAYLKASNTDAGDNFGYSVSLSSDTLAVGAWGEDSAASGVDSDSLDNTAPDSGAVYVFQRSGTTWAQEVYLKASNTNAEDAFGLSVSLFGDALAVGAWNEDSVATGVNGDQLDNTAPDSGAVYVFQRSGTTWAQEVYLKASNTNAEDFFGYSVSLSGDVLIAGAFGEDSLASGVDGDQLDNGALESGAAYVFRRDGDIWQQDAYLKASNPGAGDEFGISVALHEDALMVGAWEEDGGATGVDGDGSDDTAPNGGAAYFFRRTGDQWAEESYLKASNTQSSDGFGWSVAISKETLAVGAIGEDSNAITIGGDEADNNATNSGAVYIFH